ncbi:hypothetical protein BJV82DRAFT_663257 [Fennellomyces sp. T-0311]|nr:hypothetical protein BJV82DRAFT_663257 [Fennellomyces sp. T-0311]
MSSSTPNDVKDIEELLRRLNLQATLADERQSLEQYSRRNKTHDHELMNNILNIQSEIYASFNVLVSYEPQFARATTLLKSDLAKVEQSINAYMRIIGGEAIIPVEDRAVSLNDQRRTGWESFEHVMHREMFFIRVLLKKLESIMEEFDGRGNGESNSDDDSSPDDDDSSGDTASGSSSDDSSSGGSFSDSRSSDMQMD